MFGVFCISRPVANNCGGHPLFLNCHSVATTPLFVGTFLNFCLTFTKWSQLITTIINRLHLIANLTQFRDWFLLIAILLLFWQTKNWRWQLVANGCGPHLQSNYFKSNETASQLHTVTVILVVLWSPTTQQLETQPPPDQRHGCLWKPKQS